MQINDIYAILSDIVKVEGGYSDNPNDSGGKTKYGITEKVARANGYAGDMRDLPEATAIEIYYTQYVIDPGFDKVLLLSRDIAIELVDTGINCGTGTAAKFLQSSLNAFNKRGSLWPDLVVDGGIGQKTINALAEYLKNRLKDDGERVMLSALNSLQAARYIELSQAGSKKDEDFVYGWIRNRAML